MKIKRILADLISIFVLVAIIIGCSGGDNPAGPSEPIDEKLLIGRWQRQLRGNEGCPPEIEEYRTDYVYIEYWGACWNNWQASGTWRIEGNNTLITRGYGPGNTDIRRTIVSISQSEMRLDGVIYNRI